MTHQRLATRDAIAAERPVWDEWVGRRYDANPFLSLDWHLVWLEHFATPATEEIHYIKVLNSQWQPVAYFPLILNRELFRGFTVRVLRFAGNLYSPVNIPLLGEGAPASLFDDFVQGALPDIPWQLFRGDDLPPEYPGANELEQALLRSGHAVYLREAEGNWIYQADGDVTAEAFHRQLGSNLRSDTRRFDRKLAAAGRFEYRLVAEDLTPTAIDDYRSVYGRSWKVPEIDPTFHPDVMAAMARRGCLRLGLLYLDDRPIAAQFWLLSARRGYVVKLAYDEAYGRFKPGTVLTWKIVEQLIAGDRMNFFDYLKGDDAYKQRWAPIHRRRISLLGFRRGPTGMALHFLDQRLLPWVRRSPVVSVARRRFASEPARGVPARHFSRVSTRCAALMRECERDSAAGTGARQLIG